MTNRPSLPTTGGRAGKQSANGATARAIRRARNLQQDLVAKAAGWSSSYLSRVENGFKFASADKTRDLARALDVPVEVLTGQKPAIAVLRQAAGLSPQQLADDISISVDTVKRLERGIEFAGPELLAIIANRLAVDPAALRSNLDLSEVA